MPETFGTHTSTGAETRGGEVTNVREGNLLLNTGIAAAATNNGGTVVRTREDIVLHHTDAERQLVSIELVPLVCGQSTLEAFGTIVVADFGSNDNTAKVATGRGVECWQRNTTLRNQKSCERNAIGVQAGRSNISCSRISSND